MSGSITVEAKGKLAKISMTGPIEDWNAFRFEEDVNQAVQAGATNFMIYIDSKGGDVFSANRICNIIDGLPSVPDCRIGAICASAATRIALKCKKRTIASNGFWMIHKPMVYMAGNEDDLASKLKAMKSITSDYRKAYAEATGKTEKDIDELWKADYWCDAKEAKQLGFVTDITDAVAITSKLVEDLQQAKCPDDLLGRVAAQVQSIPNNEYEMKKELLVAALGNSVPGVADLGDNVSEAQFAAKVNEALKAKDDKIAELQGQIKTQKDGQIKALVDTAVKEGRITAEEKPKWEKMLDSDFDSAAEILSGLAKRVDINAQVRPGGGNPSASADESKKDWDYGKWEKEDPKGLAKMRAESFDQFKELFKGKYGVYPD
ncbi:MAG: hypothetical protein GC192_23450 [Bacteroidetes bacterium]|nr:hypothetical protein [Bacteroidota bacterium]